MNNFVWDVILNFFVSFTTFWTANYFFSLFSSKTVNKKTLIGIIFFICFFAAQFSQVSIIKVPILIICTLAVAFNYSFKFYNKILFTVIFIAFNGLIELITTILMSLIFSVSVDGAMDGVLLAFWTIISKFLVGIFLVIITIIKRGTLFGKFKIQWLSIYILPIASLLVTYSLYFSIRANSNDVILRDMSLLSLILLILSNMLVFQRINNLQESIAQQNELLIANEVIKSQKKQYNLVIENNDRIIKIRHDHKNFIIGLVSLLESNKLDSIKTALISELNLLNDKINTSLCGDSVIDSIINYKRAEAESCGISIDFDYRNIGNINVSGVDFSVLLGNAIDNAIEALKSNYKINEKTVSVKIFRNHDQIMITVSNKVTQNIDVDKLQTHKGDMHGYGIISMRSIAQKYNGDVLFSCENLIFKCIIVLHNTDECADLTDE